MVNFRCVAFTMLLVICLNLQLETKLVASVLTWLLQHRERGPYGARFQPKHFILRSTPRSSNKQNTLLGFISVSRRATLQGSAVHMCIPSHVHICISRLLPKPGNPIVGKSAGRNLLYEYQQRTAWFTRSPTYLRSRRTRAWSQQTACCCLPPALCSLSTDAYSAWYSSTDLPAVFVFQSILPNTPRSCQSCLSRS